MFTLSKRQPPRNFSSLTTASRRIRWSALGRGAETRTSRPRKRQCTGRTLPATYSHQRGPDIPAAQPDHCGQTLADDARSILADAPNSGLVINERSYDVLTAVRTRTPMLEARITATWFTWVKSMEASHLSWKV